MSKTKHIPGSFHSFTPTLLSDAICKNRIGTTMKYRTYNDNKKGIFYYFTQPSIPRDILCDGLEHVIQDNLLHTFSTMPIGYGDYPVEILRTDLCFRLQCYYICREWHARH